VRYVLTCHTITVTNYHFMWCSAVTNVIFNTGFGSVIFYIGKFYFKDFFLNCNFELFGENCMKIITKVDFSFELQIIKVFEVTR
jgi:hypothetical protein